MRALLPLVLVASLTACSQASYQGDLDDDGVPFFFTGAFGNEKINGSEFVVAVWSSLPNTCDLATQFLTDVNGDIDDADDVVDALDTFATDKLPQDWWFQIVIASAEDDDDIEGAEIGDNDASVSTLFCHFTEAIDVDDDTPDASCATPDQGSDLEITEFVKDERIVIESDLDLVRSKNGDEDDVGSIEGRAEANFCQGFSDAFDDFVDACDDGEDGCSPAIQRMFIVVNPSEGSPPIEGEGEEEGECEIDEDCGSNAVCDAGECVQRGECSSSFECQVTDESNSPISRDDDGACAADEVAYEFNGDFFCGIEDGADDVFCSDIDPDLTTATVTRVGGGSVDICVAEVFCEAGSCTL